MEIQQSIDASMHIKAVRGRGIYMINGRGFV